MFYQVQHYLKFLKASTNQHGVHSPFVYDLVTKCFYNKTKYTEYLNLREYRNRLKKVDLQLNISDLGAGSSVLNTSKRKVSDIVKHVSISNKNAKLLFRIAKYFEFSAVLELGTSLGIATQALSLGCPNAHITTIEGCPEISNYTKEQFKIEKLDNIKLITGNFSEVIPQLYVPKYDLVFFDGNHQKDATLQYFEMLLPKIHNDTVFIFDDIYWSKGMTEAWERIKQHPKVTVTIDTFYWGIVFFRTEQAKQDFTIRT